MMVRALTGILPIGWYQEITVIGVISDMPGIYEWRIEGMGCYIGQYTKARRPRREYALNVERILTEKPYRKGKPEGFRKIHLELAQAVQAGQKITLTLLENHASKVDRNRRERELIAERRAHAAVSGLRVLNSG
jgi:hypothetical protein